MVNTVLDTKKYDAIFAACFIIGQYLKVLGRPRYHVMPSAQRRVVNTQHSNWIYLKSKRITDKNIS